MPNNITAITNKYTCEPDALKTHHISTPVVVQNSEKKSFGFNPNPPAELLFTAADDKVYDFKDIACSILISMEKELISNTNKEHLNILKKLINCFSNNIDEKMLNLNNKICDLLEKISNADNIETLFEDLTGVKYSQENLNKFLRHEIQLKISKEYTAITNKEEPNSNISPLIDKNYYAKQETNKKVALSKTEQKVYNNIAKILDNNYKLKLNKLLIQGKLTNEKAQNNTTVLESLNKIIAAPRFKGIEAGNILKECLDILENPSIITQQSEDIPEKYQEEIINTIYKKEKTKIIEEWKKEQVFCARTSNEKQKTNPTESELKDFIKEKVKYRHVGTCAAASIEYDLASKYPAEFFRMVEALTAQNPKAVKNIDLMKPYHNVEMELDNFKIDYTKTNSSNAQVRLKIDNGAILLAQIQNNYKDDNERSIVDIIMQSMIMNLGSGGTYNSLSDTRDKSMFSENCDGLVEQEIQTVKEILTGTPVFNAQYRKFDGNEYKFTKTKKSIRKEINDALNKGENIVVGYIFGNNETGYSGHEITIIGKTKNINNENFFICQDSDDELSTPVAISEEFILSNIHHASFADKDNSKNEQFMKQLQQQFPNMFMQPVGMSSVLK